MVLDGEAIFPANYLINLIALIICCHRLVTLKSRIDLQEQPRILDSPVTGLTATNLSCFSFFFLMTDVRAASAAFLFLPYSFIISVLCLCLVNKSLIN